MKTSRAAFDVVTPNRVYALAADSPDAARQWIEAINNARASAASSAAASSSPLPPRLALTSSSSFTSSTTPASAWSAGQRSGNHETINSASAIDDGDGKGDSGDDDWIAGEKVLYTGPELEDVLYTHHSLRDGKWAKFSMSTYRLVFVSKVRHHILN
jgi:hypothetical protein